MKTLTVSSLLLLAAAAAIDAGADTNAACALVKSAELEPIAGGKIALNAGSLGTVQVCSGNSPAVSVMVRHFTRTTDAGGAKEKAGIDALRKMGAQVEVKVFGPITCVATIPPQNMAQYGYGTSCTVNKAPKFAVIEVTAKARKDMVPMERLRPIAESMAGRF